MTSKVIKSVSFNVNNPAENQMLKAIKRRNFSGYVKKLIAADLDAKVKSQVPQPQDVVVEVETQITPEIPEVPEVKVQTASERLSELKRNTGMSGPKIFRP